MPVRLSNPGQTRITDPVSQRNRTGTHLSTLIYFLVNGIAVAAVRQLSIREEREIAQIAEVGTDGLIDSAPQRSTRISGSCQRTRFDRQRIAEAFLRGFVHVSAQRIPFDLEIQDHFAAADDESVIITTVRNVWISSIETTYNSDDFIIIDNMNWMGEAIDSILGNGQPVVGNVNNRGIPIEVNPFEQSADVGRYRGALDAPNLIAAFDGTGGRAL